MAYPTAVNSQITDSVSQAGVVTLGSAPAVALASLYQAVAQTIAMAAHNATFAQQQAYITAQAATRRRRPDLRPGQHVAQSRRDGPRSPKANRRLVPSLLA
ncbi:RebB family R body protein [Sphingomonas sp. Ant H11]|uniref:RebB family R body protein n=1 Tax=Sphingomonas sp. Ant H11 TaxID=1564113 RepID=UPI000A8F46D8|nr:RebB family R body protein [Sphingomonas sp. Ant H11]